MTNWKPFGVVAGALTLVLCVLSWAPADAQPTAGIAKITRATGRVEILPKGQTQWSAIGVGGQIAEGGQVRAFSGASAELALPDGSTVTVAENTRFAVTKMDYDAQTRERFVGLHVVVGKLRAQVVRAAVQLARTRQSNFLISGPSGVAAVRGTVVVYIVNPQTGQTLVAVFPSPGQDPATATATFVPIGAPPGTPPITLTAGQFSTITTGSAPSAPALVTSLPAGTQAALQTVVNTATAGSDALTTVSITTLVDPVTFLAENIETVTTTVTATTAPPPPPPLAGFSPAP
jgi:phosphatidylethanolamine-binding protein (PEBP) family uncharacterized protein